jgi:hypothetical protein
MHDLIDDLIASLRENQKALDLEVRPLLETRYADRAMLMRLRSVAEEFAGQAQRLRQMMLLRADEKALAALDQFYEHFQDTADQIVRAAGDAESSSPASAPRKIG